MSASLSHTCVWCGALFSRSQRSKRVTCSNVCARKLHHEHNRKALVEILCPACGKTFGVLPNAVKHRTYCSKACAYQVRLGQIPYNKFPERMLCCAFCHKEVPVSGALRNRKYCDAACRIASTRGRVSHKKQIPIELSCQWCRKSFAVTASYKSRRYCSRQCASNGKTLIRGKEHHLYIAASHVERRCATCGTRFAVKRAIVLKGQGRFCSRACVGAYSVALQKGRPSSLERRVATVLTQLGEPYYAQMPLGPWCADFFLPRLNLVLECDGIYWHTQEHVQVRDRRKDGWLRKHGYGIVRLTEAEIRADASLAVRKALFDFMIKQASTPLGPPPPLELPA